MFIKLINYTSCSSGTKPQQNIYIYIFFLSLQNFAKEFMISDPRELEEDYLRKELKKAGGANYDAQAE